jgi:hypothetical protein
MVVVGSVIVMTILRRVKHCSDSYFFLMVPGIYTTVSHLLCIVLCSLSTTSPIVMTCARSIKCDLQPVQMSDLSIQYPMRYHSSLTAVCLPMNKTVQLQRDVLERNLCSETIFRFSTSFPFARSRPNCSHLENTFCPTLRIVAAVTLTMRQLSCKIQVFLLLLG